jgi:hypothetical protein
MDALPSWYRRARRLATLQAEITVNPDNSQSSALEPAPRGTVVVLSNDLFFGMRIRTVLRQLGYVVTITKDPAEFQAGLEGVDQSAVLGLVDFNQPRDWEALQPAIASGVPVIGFGSHTDVEGFRAAKTAGVVRVVSNGEFTRSLPDLVAKYATA